MPSIKLEQFGGMLPAWDAHLLPTGQAAYSRNGYLFSGALTGWRAPSILRTLQNSAANFVYRIPVVTQAQARAYLGFTSQPNAGDTVVVGDLTYTFVTTLANAEDVLIGTTAAVTADNFRRALTADNNTNTGASVVYGPSTASNGDVYFTMEGSTAPTGMTDPTVGNTLIGATSVDWVLVGAKDFGAAFNLIALSESTSGARLKWLYDLNSLSHTTTTFLGGSNPTFDTSITGNSTWMEFTDPDTNVIKSPLVNDQWNRYYFASPSTMPSYNTYDRIVAGSPAWLLGVPPPGCAPVLSVAGGGNNLTLGNPDTFGPDVFLTGNIVYLTKVTHNGDTQIQDVQFNLSSTAGVTDTTTKFAAVIYEDNNNAPGFLLNTGQIVTGVTTSNNISTFLNPTGLTNNTPYWIGFIIDTQNTFAGGAVSGVSFTETFTNGPPATAPAASATGGIQIWGDFITSDIVESRSYVYTWVSRYGEEGPPSPPALLDGWSNGVWTVGLWTPPPDDLGVLRDLTNINIYRTVTSVGGTAVFFFVATVPIGTVSYTDTNPGSTVALNDQLPSTNWFPPPANLQGLVALQNGMVAGFIGTEVWISDPYRPHAWPPVNVLTVDYPIVGLGVTNGALVACTNATAYVISGNAPDQMTQQKCSLPNPCLSRGSIIGNDQSVTYMSPNGLIQVTAAGVATNTTDLWITREKWQQLTPQKYARAIHLASCYYCLGSVSPPSVSPVDVSYAQSGFTIELDQDNTSFTIWPQPGGHRLGFNVLNSPTTFNIANVITDPWTGTGMLISNGKVYYFDFSNSNPTYLPYRWTSKIYQQNVKRNYEAMKVFFTVPVTTPTQNADPNTAVASDSSWDTLQDGQYGILRTFVDIDGTGNMTLIDCREIRGSGQILRVVDGFKAEQWQWQIDARVIISNVQIATTAKELAGV